MTSPHILIIDDDYNLGNICALVFNRSGFETEIIADGKIALARLNDILPRMILLDLHMPGIPGEEILECIRADERLADTIVVLTTADLVLMNKLRDKADHTLPKPFKVEQLRNLGSII